MKIAVLCENLQGDENVFRGILRISLENGIIQFPKEFSKDSAWLLMKDTGFEGGAYFVQVCAKEDVFDFLKNTCDETIVCVSAGDFLLSPQNFWEVPSVILNHIDFREVDINLLMEDAMTIVSPTYVDKKLSEITDMALDLINEFESQNP